MKNREVISVDSFDNLSIHIYTIGYPIEGEAILFVLQYKDKVLFTSLTDCYEYNNYNHIETILNNLGKPNIDLFIWTHPDTDHSIAIRNILDKFDSERKARICLPDSLYCYKYYNISNDSQKSLEYLFNNYNKGKKKNVMLAIASEQECRSIYQFDIQELNTRSRIRCEFKCMSPIDTIVSRRIFYGQSPTVNDLSIVHTIEINNKKFLLTGDLTNQTSQFLNNEYLSDVDFIKIPHHGSSEPVKFNDIIIKNNIRDIVSVTTIKGNDHPVDDVINKYKRLNHKVYSTGRGKDDFGCVEYAVSFNDMENCYIHESGNASSL